MLRAVDRAAFIGLTGLAVVDVGDLGIHVLSPKT